METIFFSAIKFGAGLLAAWVGFRVRQRTNKIWLGWVTFIVLFFVMVYISVMIGIPATTSGGGDNMDGN